MREGVTFQVGSRNGIGEGGICPLGLEGPGDSAVVLGDKRTRRQLLRHLCGSNDP